MATPQKIVSISKKLHKGVVFAACLLSALSGLQAQSYFDPMGYRLQNQVVWMDGRSSLNFSTTPVHPATLSIQGKAPKLIHFPPKTWGATWRNGFFWATRIHDDGKGAFLKSKDGATWEKFADPTEKMPDYYLPLGKPGCYLFANIGEGVSKGNKASVFSIYRTREDGKLELDDVIQLPFAKPAFRIETHVPEGGPKEKFEYVSLAPTHAMLRPFLGVPVQTQGYILLASIRSGMIWILSGENGELKRVINLYDIEEKELGSEAQLQHAILAIQPKSDGKVLIAARDIAAFHFSSKVYKYQSKPQLHVLHEQKDEGSGDPDEARLEETRAVQTFPDIVWWELDPETGKLERVYPEGAPLKVRTVKEFQKFRFSFEPGDVLKTSIPGDKAHR